MNRRWTPEGEQRLALGQPFVLESGEALPGLEIAYRTWGKLSPQADNAIIVCHALTADADAARWWAPLFGPGCALDPADSFIVCSNALGSCYGTTGPTSLAPDGKHWGARFPRVTIRDQVRAQIALADALGIRSIRFVIGGSMGGLQALEWALLDPLRTQAVISVAGAASHSPWALVWNEAQRLALRADPLFRGGFYPPEKPPEAGLAAARAIAMVSYRSPQSLEARFGRERGADIFGPRAHSPDEFAARGWLRHHAKNLTERFDANSYVSLLDALDSHDLARARGSLEAALGKIHQPTLIGSIASDALYLPAEQHELARLIPNARLLEIDSAHGHDGFLIDAARFEPGVRRFASEQRSTGATPADTGAFPLRQKSLRYA
ncbi:homoserine O-acetyltransferase MetX [Niveibacterium terrae]|uniref:homoserine O-acetyltransferase MetX n=1 Tax=Niveibacterium terrae TaxID=3373598 RepID=UPI003A92DECC